MILPGHPLFGLPFSVGEEPAPLPNIGATPAKPNPVYQTGAIFRDFFATPSGKDIDFGYQTGPVLVANVDAIAQQANLRLSIFRNELLYDQDLGVDYYGQVFGVGRTQLQIESAFRAVLLKVPGIRAVTRLAADIRGSGVVVTWQANTDQSQLAAGQVTVTGGV